MVKFLKTFAISLFYIAVAVLIALFVFRNGIYPSGSDTMSYIYKSEVLYRDIFISGNLYPLYDPMLYNGIQMFRYFTPLPVYVLACCQAIAGGDVLIGYLIFVAFIFLLGALAWLIIGVRHNRIWLGAFMGALWFFMPNNLYVLFSEGNLARSLCMVFLPLFISYIHDYLLDNKWSSLPKLIVISVLIVMCGFEYTIMIVISFFIYAVVYMILNKGSAKKIGNCIISIVLAILITGIWTYPSFENFDLTANPEVMVRFFQSAVASLNPVLRTNFSYYSTYYYGLAVFIIDIFGIIFCRKKSVPGFVSAIIIFLCTTTIMYSVFVSFPGSKYLLMLKFISIALCFTLYSLFLWDSLKKLPLFILCLLLVVDTVPSLVLISGRKNGITAEERFDLQSEIAMIDKAKSITKQRLALLDMNTLEATGAYLISGYKEGVQAAFGIDLQSATTSNNVVQLNQSLQDGKYYYLFDRCIELGNDTVLVQTAQLKHGNNDISDLDYAANRLGYKLVDINDDYRLYHLDTYDSFGVISEYRAIGIGKSAGLLSVFFPALGESDSDNLDDYTFDELKDYDIIYLGNFTYYNKERAEELILSLSEAGVRVIILADGIPVDDHIMAQNFLGVTCYNVEFLNGYPEFHTENGIKSCDLFLGGYSKWSTVYTTGLDNILVYVEELGKSLCCLGTVKNDNIFVISLNLPFHYELTEDKFVEDMLIQLFGMNPDELPSRTIVPLTVNYGKRSIRVATDYDGINTTLAYHDIFTSSQNLYTKNHLTYVDKGTTVIELHYPKLFISSIISSAGILLTIMFLGRTRKMHILRLRQEARAKKEAENNG